jgi:hypothetical protein
MLDMRVVSERLIMTSAISIPASPPNERMDTSSSLLLNRWEIGPSMLTYTGMVCSSKLSNSRQGYLGLHLAVSPWIPIPLVQIKLLIERRG